MVTEVEDEFLDLSPRFIKFFKVSPIIREIKVMAMICLCLAYGNFNHLFPTRFTESGNSHRFVKESAQIKFLTAINSIKWLDQGQKFKSQSLIVDWIG